MDYLEVANAAAVIAREAGGMLREHLNETRRVATKSSANDLVTEMDRRTEAFLVERILAKWPDHGVVCEEGTSRNAESPWRWHVDPIDGTNNYLHRFPWFAVSLGLEHTGRMAAAVVYNVMLDEMFTAAAGAGAWCNGERIRVSDAPTLDASLLATGFPYWIGEERASILVNLEAFLTVCHGVRRAGVASLDLACVACGRFDGYWEESLKSWDVAAGVLLVREAGGRVTDYRGAPVEIPTAHLVASNGRIHDAMVARLEGRWKK